MTTTFRRYASHYRALISLGVPIVVGQLGTIILSFADTLMVGHHSMKELAAASFVNTIFVIILLLALGFSNGLTPIIGNYFGRDETAAIGKIVRNGALANLLVGSILLIPATLLYKYIDRMGQPAELIPLMRPYLLVNILSLPFVCWFNTFKQFFDAIGHTKTSMFVMIGGNILNIAGNYVLIYGIGGCPELGLLGAGISTAFSRIAMAIGISVVFFCISTYTNYRHFFLHSTFSRHTLLHISNLGWPLSLQMGMESAAFSLVAIMVGWIGTTALAAHQIMLTTSQLFYLVYYGLGAAVAVRMSHFFGQHDYAAMKETSTAGFHIILTIAAIVAIPVFLLRSEIGTWFTDSEEVRLLVSHTIIPLIIYQFGDGMQCTFANALRGVAHVKPMMYISFVAYFLISLPLSWLFGIYLQGGLVGIWSAFPICLTTAGILYYLYFRRALQKITVQRL